MRAANRCRKIEVLRRHMAFVHRTISVVPLNSLSFLCCARTGSVKDNVRRLTRQLTGLLQHSPKPQIDFECVKRSVLGPTLTGFHVDLAGSHQDGLSRICEC